MYGDAEDARMVEVILILLLALEAAAMIHTSEAWSGKMDSPMLQTFE